MKTLHFLVLLCISLSASFVNAQELEITCPNSDYFECDDELFLDQAMATSGCDGDIQITYSEFETGDDCETVLTRTWSATDECGGEASCSQSITIFDIEPPIISNEPNPDEVITISYNGTYNLIYWQDYFVLEDQCNDPGMVISFVLLSEEEAELTIWLGDGCGNSYEYVQNYSYVLEGCTDIEACNFDPFASITALAACDYIGDTCSDSNSETTNDFLNESCECIGQVSGCTDAEALNYNPLAVIDNNECNYSVTFSVNMENVELSYTAPEINGTFNGWCGNCTPLENLGQGIYSLTMPLQNGTYEYKFSADSWDIQEELAEGAECTLTSGEFTNRIITVNSNIDLGVQCWGECSDCISCSDPTACNYSAEALPEELNCSYIGDTCTDENSNTVNDVYLADCACEGELLGCTNPNACNFNPEALAEDGSCEFITSPCFFNTFLNGWLLPSCECAPVAYGVTFIDANFNGLLDEGETPLPFQTVIVEELGIQFISDDQGQFIIHGIDEGTYTITANYSTSWTTYTTEVSQVFLSYQASNELIRFGVSQSETPPPVACVDFYQSGIGVPCNDILDYNICYRNMSSFAISGTVEVTLDPLLSYNYSYPDASDVNGQVITWEFEDLASWSMNFDDLVVDTPDETHIGEWMTSSVTISAWYEGELIPITTETIVQEITCAYDPNDITGIPEGYTDEHWVMSDTSMEYLIRFQNTGNAPAGTVMVVDTLDPGMDFSTFQLVANSHSVLTTIEPSGRVEFLFENIQLPDSTTNEAESHGLVSFKIDFLADIAVGEELNQTAYIYFDNNPPVVTNTTWHTIHECGGEAAFEVSATEICQGETVDFTSLYNEVEVTQWNVDSVSESMASSFSKTFEESGEYIIQLVAENPLCNASSMQLITVYEAPAVEFTQEGDVLSATVSESYQWLLNGEEIEGATEEDYTISEDGIYSVMVSNDNNCTAVSEGVMIVGISEFEKETILLYPNPMTDVAYLEFEDLNIRTVRLINSSGKEIRVWENISSEKLEIKRRELTAGNYSIHILSKGKAIIYRIVVL